MNAANLLAVWESAAAQLPVRRAVALLAASMPERPASEWLSLPVGERDRRLLAVREDLFGSRLETIATCPRCKTRLEMNFLANEIFTAGGSASEHVRVGEFEVDCRPANSADLLEVSSASNPGSVLLSRCILGASKSGVSVSSEVLPQEVVDVVVEAIARTDPDANAIVNLVCPACETGWSVAFDIVSYFWSEIDDWARRALAEIHALASAYGWTEREILSLSARRRQMYIELASGTLQ